MGRSNASRAFLLADMIGDRDLDVERDLSSTPWLLDLVGQAAAKFGDQSYFFQRQEAVGDDHTPFMQRGVPCADIIDFDYGYQNAFWHTPQDTMDKLSAKSLTIVGDVFLETMNQLIIESAMPQMGHPILCGRARNTRLPFDLSLVFITLGEPQAHGDTADAMPFQDQVLTQTLKLRSRLFRRLALRGCSMALRSPTG
jgi:hypothetical protein